MKTRRTKPLISQFSGRWARIVLGVLFTAFAVIGACAAGKEP